MGWLVSGVARRGAREGFLWAEASGVYSGCEFCLLLEAGLVFWLSPLSVGKGKKLEKLSLVLETVSFGSLVSAKQKLVDFWEKKNVS